MSKADRIIGTGWSFPPRFSRFTGAVETVTGEREILDSLRILFGTERGERILKLDYGSELSSEVFQNISLSQKTVLESKLKRAILHYEPRIKLENLAIDTADAVHGTLRIQLEYTILATNSRRNIVSPFFVEEGTLIPTR